MSFRGRVDLQTVLIVGVLVYVAALALLSPGLPAAVADFFGIRPTEAFVVLAVAPAVAMVIALILIARDRARRSTN